jgi:hypothetical protein
MSTFGFGIFACALFMATRSYWIVAVFHALSDWTVVFDREYRGEDTTYVSPIWENLGSGVMGFITSFGPIGLGFLWIMRGRWPKWAIRLAIKWKLVEQAEAIKS